MLLACVQSDIQIAELSTNFGVVKEILQSVQTRNVDLVVFPECMLCGYGFESRKEAIASAVTEDSSEIRQLIELAGQLNLTLSIGLLLKSGHKLHNAALLIDGTGIRGRYHKVHLPHLGVDRFVDRGELPYEAFEIDCLGSQAQPGHSANAKVGLGICYDSSFPEPMRALGLAGADVIALGTNWPVAASRTAQIVPPARSMENHLFFVAANRIGHERTFDFCGLSSICGPDGVELARAVGDETTVLFADIDLAQARNKRIERTPGKHVIDRFADRQPSFYNSLTRPIDSQ